MSYPFTVPLRSIMNARSNRAILYYHASNKQTLFYYYYQKIEVNQPPNQVPNDDAV
jgi:hypothetical protein